MAQVTLKKSLGPQGNGKVTIGNKVIRISLNGEIYELPLDQWDKKRPAGEYNILLSKNLDKIISLRPPAPGTHIVRFVRFGNRTNEIPEPKVQRGGPRETKSGGKYIAPDKLVFTALLEVCDGSQYDGLQIADNHVYGFEPVPGSPDSMITMDNKRDLERFEIFMRVQGFSLADMVIPYSSNVLPWLEAYMQASAKPFMVATNENGFIDSRSVIPAHLLPGKNKSTKRTKK